MARKIRLLIVDDEERFLRTLAERLELRDFEVTPVTSGQQALDAARETEFDLALIDLKMPGMSGEQLLRELRRDHPAIEVIILTGHGSVDSAVQCMREGSYHYLQKPCGTEDLLEVLKNAYRSRVQRKLRVDESRMESLMRIAQSESPLAILRRLRELEEEGR